MNRVLSVTYFGLTELKLLDLLRAAQDRLTGGGGQLTGASVNGQSFQRSEGSSVRTEINEIYAALSSLNPSKYPPRSTTINVRFGCAR